MSMLRLMSSLWALVLLVCLAHTSCQSILTSRCELTWPIAVLFIVLVFALVCLLPSSGLGMSAASGRRSMRVSHSGNVVVQCLLLYRRPWDHVKVKGKGSATQ